MKRLISLLLCATMVLTGCTSSNNISPAPTIAQETEPVIVTDVVTTDAPTESATKRIEIEEFDFSDSEVDINQFSGLDDTNLHSYIEDCIYAEMTNKLQSDDYLIENIVASYISQEYLEEIEFNSQANVYFGYTLSELNDVFQGEKYIFTLGEDGKTTVQELEEITDTTNEEILKNVAIGTGIFVIYITVSYLTAGVPVATNLLFTSSALTLKDIALTTTIGGVAAGAIRGIETGDMNEALEAGSLSASEAFKWTAIATAVVGGGSKALEIIKSSRKIPSPRQSELKVLSMFDDAIEQVSFFNGKEVSNKIAGCTRPDVVIKNADGTIRAIEVKNYNLENSASLNVLFSELKRQVKDRNIHLPTGSTQEIVLDTRGRGYKRKFVETIVSAIKTELNDIYYDIPINVL